jgi:two-component system, NarL family, nitrate/nitrite response regulator NarL
VDLLPDPRKKLLRPDIRVFVLVAVRLYRDGIVGAFRGDTRFRVVGSAASLDRARRELDALPAPADIALVDLEVADGVEAARELRRDWPSTAIVALAVREVDDEVVRWAEAGVSGLVTRDATLAQVLDAVEAAANDEVLCTPSVAAALLRRVASLSGGHASGEPQILTRREREIVGLVADGLSNKEIAHTLHIELATVKNHVHNILEKLHVGGRTEAVTAARARGELGRI